MKNVTPIRWLSFGLCALLARAALAEEPHTFEVTPLVGYRAGGEFTSAVDGNRKLNSSASYGAILNLLQTPGAYYELTYSKQNTELAGSVPLQMSLEYIHFGGLLEFADPEDRVIPYFALTVGATRFIPKRPELSAETEFSFALGGGIKIPLGARVALRAEVRGYATLLNANSSIFCVASASAIGCDIRVKGDAFVQVQAVMGLTVGF